MKISDQWTRRRYYYPDVWRAIYQHKTLDVTLYRSAGRPPTWQGVWNPWVVHYGDVRTSTLKLRELLVTYVTNRLLYADQI